MRLPKRKAKSSLQKNLNFKDSYKELYDIVYKYCFLQLGCEQEALDCTQEVFVRYCERLQTGIKIDNPKAYVYKIAYRVCVKRKNELEILKYRFSELYYVVDTLTIEEQIELEQLEHRIEDVARKIIDSLKPEEKELYENYFIRGVSVNDIAKAQHVTPSWINKRILRLKESVKYKVKKYLAGGDYGE